MPGAAAPAHRCPGSSSSPDSALNVEDKRGKPGDPEGSVKF